MPRGEIIFGYRHITSPEVPRCPCNDPGDYLLLQQRTDDPLECRLLCWCGRSIPVDFDNENERMEFILLNTAD